MPLQIPKSNISSIEEARARLLQEKQAGLENDSGEMKKYKPNKYTYVQDYENQLQTSWYSMVRNKDIYDYDSFFYAISKHPAVYAVVNKIVENMFKGGYEIVPRKGIKHPSEKQRAMLEAYLANVHPDGYTFMEIMKDAWTDCLPCGTKLVQIDEKYPYLYGNLDFGTFRPNINEYGLFNEGWKWEQIILGQVVAQLFQGQYIWYRLPGKHILIYPRSPLEPLLTGIETDLFGKLFNKNRFTNSSSFGNIFILPENSDSMDAKTLKAYIEQNYVSQSDSFGELTTDNSYKNLVLYNGAKIDQSIVDRFKDIDFIQLRSVTIKDVCMCFDMPLRVMSIEESGLGQAGANDAAMSQFYGDLIIPQQTMWEDQTDAQLTLGRLECTDWRIQLIRPKWINEEKFTNLAISLKEKGVQTADEARFMLKDLYSHLGYGKNNGIELQDWENIAVSELTQDKVLNGAQVQSAINIVTLVAQGVMPKDAALGQLMVMFNLTEEQAKKILGSIKSSATTQKSCGHNHKKLIEDNNIPENIRQAAEKARKAWNYRMVESDLNEGENAIQTEFDAISDKMFADAKKQASLAWKSPDNQIMFTFKLKYKADLDSLLRIESAKIFDSGRKDVDSQMGKRSCRKADLDTLNKYKQLVKKESKQASEDWYIRLEKEMNIIYNSAIAQKLSENQLIKKMSDRFDVLRNSSPAIVRTMTTGFYNLGRAEMMYEVGDFVEYVQFSAIMDDRTTERCERLDGDIMRKDSDFEKIMPPLHYNCFIDGQTAIYTSKGWEQIKNIELGDLILTHKGKFKPATFIHHKKNPTSYDGDVIKITIKMKKRNAKGFCENFITTTLDHPFLTQRGWVKACELNKNDKLNTLAFKCKECGEVMPWRPWGYCIENMEMPKYCSGECAMKNNVATKWSDERKKKQSKMTTLQLKREYDCGIRSGSEITKKAHEKTKEMAAKGEHPFQKTEVRKYALKKRMESEKWKLANEAKRGENNVMHRPEVAKKSGESQKIYWLNNPEKHSNRKMGLAIMKGQMGYISKGQRSLYDILKKIFPNAELEYPVKLNGKLYYLDIAIPEHKINFEFDGSYWHNKPGCKEKDIERDLNLSKDGWNVIRYVDHVPAKDSIYEEVSRIMANHNDEYCFSEVDIEKIERWKLKKARRLYNISVQDDESYIAKGFVVHNCRSILLPITQEDVKENKKLSETTPDKEINKILNDTAGFDRL